MQSPQPLQLHRFSSQYAPSCMFHILHTSSAGHTYISNKKTTSHWFQGQMSNNLSAKRIAPRIIRVVLSWLVLVLTFRLCSLSFVCVGLFACLGPIMLDITNILLSCEDGGESATQSSTDEIFAWRLPIRKHLRSCRMHNTAVDQGMIFTGLIKPLDLSLSDIYKLCHLHDLVCIPYILTCTTSCRARVTGYQISIFEPHDHFANTCRADELWTYHLGMSKCSESSLIIKYFVCS